MKQPEEKTVTYDDKDVVWNVQCGSRCYPNYLAVLDGDWAWVTDHVKAIYFKREGDAKAVAAMIGEGTTAEGHIWTV